MGKKVLNFIIGVVLLLISFGIMSFFPYRASFLTWIIVIISAFAFIFGYYRLGLAFNGPKGKTFKLIKKLVFCAAGIFMIVYGVYYCIHDEFSGRGLGVGTLLLIYGIAMEYYAFNKAFNYAVDGIKQSDLVTASIEDLCRAFQDVDTPMGRPWMGKVKNVDGDCIIYGPTDQGAFLFGYYLFGTFSFVESQLMNMLTDDDQAAAHRIETTWDRNDFGSGQLYHLLARMLPDFYIGMFEAYSKTGRASCDFIRLFQDKSPSVYVFDEKFAVVHQKYQLLDMDGRPKYYLHGIFPFWTFRLENVSDGRELVKSKRIIWHILFPTYDIYLNGEKYGRMRWLFRILRTRFRMKTADGEVEVREMTATVGDQFGVYKNGALIGTISQKLGLTGLGQFVRDMVFDNFVIMVFDERDLPLVTTLSVMLGSFKNRGIAKE